MTKKTIEIFRAGTHVGMDGKEYTFSEAEVQAIADAYDANTFSAPAVVGHPKHDAPAYGWASDIRYEDGKLLADLDQVEPAFAQLVEDGRFKKVSASFYAPTSKNNPVPGSYYPRHIGFLGAAAPGVMGLAPVAFAEGEDGVVDFATDEELRPIVWLARNMGRLFRRLRDREIAENGIESADAHFPSWETDAPTEIAAELERVLSDTPSPRFAAPAEDPKAGVTNADIQAAELASREAAIAAREKVQADRDLAFAEEQRQARIDEDDAFLDALTEEGRLPPGLKSQFAAFCEALGESDAISFAEGDEPQDPRAAFKALLSANLGKTIHFGEIAGGEGLQFAEGQSVEDLTAAIDAEMATAASAGKPISAAEAIRRAKSRR